MKKITFLFALLVSISWQLSAQTSTVYLTTTAGNCCAGEKWVEITDGPNGTGNVIWAQGNGTYGNGSGVVTDSSFTITNGTNYYISCYDQYSDGWDGGTYEIRSASGGGGILIANNAGVSPNDNANLDALSSWETRAVELESEEMFSYTPPSCFPPSALMAGSITTTSASLSWTEGGTATEWEIEWDTAGFTQGSGTSVATTTNPHSLGSLTAQTAYEFYVRAACGANDSSAWVGPFSFTSLPGAHTIPLTEDFESGFSYFGNATGNDVDWAISTTYFHGGAQSIHNAYGASNDNVLHETGILDLSATTNPVLEFWHIAKTEGTWDHSFVEISTDNGVTYTALPDSLYLGAATDYDSRGYFHEDSYADWGTGAQTPDNTTWWRKETFLLSSYTVANVRIRFRLDSDGSGQRDGWYIDDILISEPSCPDPSALNASNVTAVSADLAWTENGTATTWDIEWDTAGFAQGAGTMVTGSTTNPHALTGLSANTSYEFYVRADCGGATSGWSGPYSFTTLCLSVADFSENFDGVGANSIPNCWSSLYYSSSTYADVLTSASNAYSGSNSLLFYNSSDLNPTWMLVSPQLTNLGAGTHRTSFYAKDSDGNDIIIGTMSDPTDTATFTPFDTITTTSTYAKYTVNFDSYSGTDTYLAYRSVPSGTYEYTYLDDVVWQAIPTCIEPDTLMASHPTTVGADLYWTEMGTATTWDVEIVTAGTVPSGTPTNAGLTSDSVTITGLASSTTYDYYVRAYCSASDQSYWSGPVTFTTACAAVSSFSENFDGVTAPAMPNCWGNVYYSSSTSANVQTNNSTTNANSGSNSVRFYNSSDLNPTWMLVSPELTNLSAGTHQTVFYAKSADSYDIIVGTMSDPMDTATFTPYDTITATPNYSEYIVSFANYSGTDNYLAYRSVHTATYDYVYMDDISWEVLPTCPKPNTLVTGVITDVTAELGWTETGSATAWEIEYDTTGFTKGTGNIVAASSNPFTLSALTANTSYEYYVRSVCGVGDSSVWVGPLSFATNPPAIATFPYINDMESGLGTYLALTDDVQSSASLDATAANGTGTGILLTGGSATGWSGGSTSTTETQAFVTNSTHVSSVKFLVDATSQSNLHMSFDFRQEATYGVNYSWGRILVNGSVLPGTAVTPATTGSDPFTTVEIDLSAFSGTVFSVELQHSGKYNVANGTQSRGDEAHIDNLKVYEAMTPSVVSVDATCFNGDDGNATVSITGGYSPYSYVWSNGDTTVVADTLTAGVYYVTITDNYGFEAMDSATISQGAALALNLGNDTSLCLNASLTLDAGSFTSYVWDDASTMQTRATVNTAVGVTNYSVTVTDANSCTGVDTIEVTVMADPIVNLGNDTSICDGETLTLDAGSFTTYAWDDASTMQTRMVSSMLGASTYSVTVTNAAGCSGSDDIVVTGFAPVMVDLGNDTSICDAVSLTLDAGSFTSYLWDDASTSQTRMTVSTVGAVDYSVEVTDANACTGNDTITITGFASPMVDLGNDTTVCDGESITLDAGAFTSYLWDDASTMQTRMTVSTMGAVDYSVEVTDANGCMAVDTIEITGSAPVMVDLGSDTSLCNGAPYTLDAGAGFTSYFWNNGFNTQTLDVSSTTAGTTTYSVRVEDAAGCSGRDTAIISVKAPVLVDLGRDTNIWANGVDTHTLDAGAGFTSYLWSDNVTTTQTYEVRRATEGLVSVIVEDADGCEGTDTVKVTFAPVGVEEFTASTLTMYPNPAVDQVTVELSNLDNVSNVNVTFLSVTGQVVLAKNIVVKGANSVETFDVSSLATGTYLVQFEANGNVVTKQFVIK